MLPVRGRAVVGCPSAVIRAIRLYPRRKCRGTERRRVIARQSLRQSVSLQSATPQEWKGFGSKERIATPIYLDVLGTMFLAYGTGNNLTDA